MYQLGRFPSSGQAGARGEMRAHLHLLGTRFVRAARMLSAGFFSVLGSDYVLAHMQVLMACLRWHENVPATTKAAFTTAIEEQIQ